MVINIVLPGIGKSGGVMAALSYASCLSNMGDDVCCYYPLAGAYTGWKKYLFPARNIWRWLHSADMRGEWMKEPLKIVHPFWIRNRSIRNADITIATSWLTAYWVSGLNRNKGKKVYFIQDYEAWGNRRQKRKAIKSYNLEMDMRVVVSTALKEKLWADNGVDSIVVCNGIPAREIRTTPKEKNSNEVVIGFPYRTSSRKNCSLGIDVLKKIKEERPEVKIVGFGFSRPNAYPTGWNFVENPSRENLMRLYDRINIFYVPSLYEGWGMPAMEAMAHGCAVLAANSGLIYEYGQDGVNCSILERPDDDGYVKRRLLELIDNQAHTFEMGEAARTMIMNRCTQEDAGVKFRKCLERVNIGKKSEL